MPAPRSLKEEILKKWILGLKIWESTKKKMNIIERKKAIKLSADIAMASTRNGMTCWRRAIVAQASKDYDNKAVVEQILASGESDNLNEVRIMGKISSNRRVRSKKILKKSRFSAKKARSKSSVAKSVAKRLVKNRTQVLKRLVPGGEFMDDISLIEETLDYMVSLQAQVDVMRTLAKVLELVNSIK